MDILYDKNIPLIYNVNQISYFNKFKIYKNKYYNNNNKPGYAFT